MKFAGVRRGADGWREFLDLLSDAVVVVDAQGRIAAANTVALRLLPFEPGTPVDQLDGVLGRAPVDWLRRAAAGGTIGAAPQARLRDGRTVALDARRVDDRHIALRIVVVDAPPADAVPPAPEAADGLPHASAFLWQSPFPTLLQRADWRIVDVNPALVAFSGFAREQLVGRDVIEFQPAEDHATIRASRERRHRDPRRVTHSDTADSRFIDAGGRERRVRFARGAFVDAGGEPLYLTVLQDTTAEHVAREHADRSLRELDDWFDLSPVGMVLVDATGLLLRANPAFEGLLGGAFVALDDAPDDLRELLGWRAPERLARLPAGAPPVHRLGRVATRHGPPRPMRASVRCYLTPAGQRRYMAVIEDRSAEEERELAQMQIGALIDTAGAGLATFQDSGGWVSPLLPERSAGSAPARESAALQSIRRDLVAPDSLAEFERLQAALRDARRAEVRYEIRHPELGPRWLFTRVEPATLASGKRATSVVTLDVTEQHRTLQRSEQLLRELGTILESASTGIAYLRGGTVVRCNQRFEAMLGLRAGKVAGRSVRQLFRGHLQTERIAAEAFQTLQDGAIYETEFEVGPGPGASGAERRWYSLSVRRCGAAGGAPEAIAVLADVTRLKAQQQELEVLARDRELMFNLSGVGIAFLRDGRIVRANVGLAQLSGWSVDELSTLHVADLFVERAEFERHWPMQQRSLHAQGAWTGERLLRARDGRLLWVQVSKRLVDAADPAGGIIASYVDVDARHRAEHAIEQQADRTRSILDSVLVGIVTVGPHGIEWMNRSARRMFGGDLADFVDLPIATVATPEPDHPLRRSGDLLDLVEGEAATFECRIRARDAREYWVAGNVVSTAREAGGRQLTYALLDIERRRQAEARVAQAQAQLQRIIEAAPLAITLRDARTLEVLQVNEVAAGNAGVGAAALIGMTPEQIFDAPTAAQRRRDMEEALAAADVTKREYQIERDGELRTWDARYLPLAAGPGLAPDQLLLVATDVTEQRAAQEARLVAALAQRDMLVKEVHHRIKNNLQGVAGLLQQIAQRKPEVAGPIAEVVSQVQAIAQVYGLQVGASGPLQLVGVVDAITASVQRTFGRTIRFAADGATAAQWLLPEAESIPIALTLNELLTNAVKHSAATPDAAVRCTLACGTDGVAIEIANRGRLPDGFQLGRVPGGVSGLGLVRALLPRRSARITLEQRGDEVVAALALTPPGVTRDASA